MSKAEIHAREAEAAQARDKLMGTLHELQHRLSPKTIVTDVKEKAKEKAEGVKTAAKEGAVQAATHPSTVAAITVPILVYLFRKPIARGLGMLLGRDARDQEPQPYQEARAPAPLPPEPVRARPKAPAEQGA
ncbi:DUF3618 domain-containing protein [Sphingomonas sp. MAH-20]|jgi:hypothetical protein|uniref:DUF3618 domain-containing protein n=1 Tax=Sphingomonas horti TaxID=2682842 RepID=A0A6I4IW29_9SPHN|nr:MULTISPECIES: DUF3618 domain-containing protein [Sphingomonas]MBA2920095.1 DUF3618 domain-containing protein [Sphingomonas sp. CGMCC 1.13658]MVO76350.1 DUF3618 domain-containing protein [Sphingomonas horti]